MTTDERLDRLVERHEALTQTVEILAQDLSDLRLLVSQVTEGTVRLLHIAQAHENRLDSHDGRLDNLEG